MKGLKRLILEYEDGSTKSISWNNIDVRVQSTLADAGLCTPSPEISSAKNYLILQWKDGWKEVVAINSDIASVIRYYVIRRIEDRGRLALDVGAEYPELLVIERLPDEVSRLLIVGDSGVKACGLESVLEGYEGIFEAGGKREYKKYDKANPHFEKEFSEAPENIADIKNALAAALNNKGLRADELLHLDQGRRIQEYKDIARMAGIRGAKRQSDVYGFIEVILRNLINAKA